MNEEHILSSLKVQKGGEWKKAEQRIYLYVLRPASVFVNQETLTQAVTQFFWLCIFTTTMHKVSLLSWSHHPQCNPCVCVAV